MSDGFSNPNPADVPDDDPVFPEFESVADENTSEPVLIDANASCYNCEHFEVCAVYSGIRPMMQDWHTEDDPDAEAPIALDKLAWICEEYTPGRDHD